MIRVLQSFPRHGPQTNPYLLQLAESMPPEIVTIGWSWQTALLGRYDVLHLHWPEVLFRRSGRIRTTLNQALFVALMLRVMMTDLVVVRTVHNPRPHESGNWFERRLLRWSDRQTTLRIALNEATDRTAGGAPWVVIAHGHYRDAYDTGGLPAPIRGRLLYFGLVRRYKGILDLITAFGGLRDRDLSLRILGSPNSVELQTSIEAAEQSDPRIAAHLRYVDDDELVRAVGESELVVLPYTELHNSGALLLALSLDRPVLVPETATTAALAQEVGPEWVLTYRGTLDAETLRNGLDRSRSSNRAARPDLSARDWPALGRQHRDAYRRALSSGRY